MAASEAEKYASSDKEITDSKLILSATKAEKGLQTSNFRLQTSDFRDFVFFKKSPFIVCDSNSHAVVVSRGCAIAFSLSVYHSSAKVYKNKLK